MSLKLYFAPGACSFVPHVLLEMSGASFDPQMVKLHKGEQNSEDYKAINPRGQVPVLVSNGQVVTQIVAIVLHLDQLFPDAHFLPSEPVARAQALSTLVWMNNTVHPTFTHIFMPQKFSDLPEVQAALKPYNTQLFRGMLGELQALVKAAAAKGQTWLTGEHFSPLDAYSLTLTRWGTIAGIAPEEHPELWAFVQKVAAQPAVARVMERERLQLNMSPAA
ncbi:glutathione S-transferase [Limnohabitans sp. T6-5]|uniref:glutathione S-transferase family protein n=1 Tax=Limnohabitans sp. T6-5 TaxID=1100724 RepID=UPI000D3A8CD7|nr:glutathione S-transferase N-terminal domain-containing protein [Limnohabitans sp. T6-5]PUE06747.1 glutathione S-transferase [Limnohabitans sp. T6-5]